MAASVVEGNRMRTPVRQFVSGGLAVAALGVLAMGLGGVRTVVFLRTMHLYTKLTPAQIVVLLVLPHMLMLAGAGLTIAGIVLIARRVLIDLRMAPDEDEDEDEDDAMNDDKQGETSGS
jgi:hypothetical protein